MGRDLRLGRAGGVDSGDEPGRREHGPAIDGSILCRHRLRLPNLTDGLGVLQRRRRHQLKELARFRGDLPMGSAIAVSPSPGRRRRD